VSNGYQVNHLPRAEINTDPKEWAWKAQDSRSTVGFIMQSIATKPCGGEEEEYEEKEEELVFFNSPTSAFSNCTCWIIY
jgi:hypothetical protein